MCFIDNGIFNVLFYRWLQWTEKQVITGICPLFFPFVWPVKNWFNYGDCSVKEREEEEEKEEEEEEEEEEEDANRKRSNIGEEKSGLPSGDLLSHWGNAMIIKVCMFSHNEYLMEE